MASLVATSGVSSDRLFSVLLDCLDAAEILSDGGDAFTKVCRVFMYHFDFGRALRGQFGDI